MMEHTRDTQREHVRLMLGRDMTLSEIAEALDLEGSTVLEHMIALEKERRPALADPTFADLSLRSVERSREQVERLWTKYEQETDHAKRIGLLRDIRGEARGQLALLGMAGLDAESQERISPALRRLAVWPSAELSSLATVTRKTDVITRLES